MDANTQTALGVVGGAAVTGFFGWLRNRNKLDSAQASTMITKLWEQNAELTHRVSECQEHHRECERKNAALEVQVATLREDFDELRRRLQRSDLLE